MNIDDSTSRQSRPLRISIHRTLKVSLDFGRTVKRFVAGEKRRILEGKSRQKEDGGHSKENRSKVVPKNSGIFKVGTGRGQGFFVGAAPLFVPKRRETTLLANRGPRLRSIEDPDTLFFRCKPRALADCFAIFGFIAAAVNDLPALRRFVGR
jgi:hypothetical protein